MIRQVTINSIKFTLAAILLFTMGFVLGINLVIPVFLLSLGIYIRYRRPYLRNYSLLNLALLFVIQLAIVYFVLDRGWPKLYIPICLIPLLTSVLFNQGEISLLVTLAVSVVTASIIGNGLLFGALFFSCGLLSSFLVLDARRRMTIIRAGFIIGIVQAIMLFFLEHFWMNPFQCCLRDYAVMLFNGLASSVIVLGVLPVFEYLFKVATNISLLELADFNHPLLQRLIIEAPGTYHHSLIMGNLSENACMAVGANALLARIGAYYHDIGKLQKPAYFSENQVLEESKHDDLSPSMSKLIIMNHVKEGVELAKKYRLNPAFIEFIQQHHGNSLVYYFYRRAVESLEDDQEVKEEGFRYPGPKPSTKETAIVLLADSVEAATRALREPAPKKIEEVVHKIINNKFIDGQLDECDLTLKDLEKISAVFIRILTGIYHSRVSYPEEPKSENNYKKSPKEDSHQSEKDNTSSP